MNAFRRVRTLAIESQNILPVIQKEVDKQIERMEKRPFSLERQNEIAVLQRAVEHAMIALLNMEIAAEKLDNAENTRVLQILSSFNINEVDH